MNKLTQVAERFRKDEDGAAMIEYTILLGIITVSVIATVILVGQWVGTQWTTLQTQLP